MSYIRGKGGKVLGEGRGAGRHDGVEGDGVYYRKGGKGVGGGREVGHQRAIEEHREDVVWLARDVRLTKGGQGSGHIERQGGAKPKRRFSCATCQDNCCGLARELVRVAFKMGKVTMSPKVMILFVYFVGLSLICRNSIVPCQLV